MTFNSQITIGDLLFVASFISGVFYFVWAMKVEIAVLRSGYDIVGKRLQDLDSEFQKLSEITATIAQQGIRLTGIEVRFDESMQEIRDFMRERIISLRKEAARKKPANIKLAP